MDPLLNDWSVGARKINAQGFDVSEQLSEKTVTEARRFLDEWIGRMQPMYMAVSLQYTFRYPDESATTAVLKQIVLPTARRTICPSRR